MLHGNSVNHLTRPFEHIPRNSKMCWVRGHHSHRDSMTNRTIYSAAWFSTIHIIQIPVNINDCFSSSSSPFLWQSPIGHWSQNVSKFKPQPISIAHRGPYKLHHLEHQPRISPCFSRLFPNRLLLGFFNLFINHIMKFIKKPSPSPFGPCLVSSL